MNRHEILAARTRHNDARAAAQPRARARLEAMHEVRSFRLKLQAMIAEGERAAAAKDLELVTEISMTLDAIADLFSDLEPGARAFSAWNAELAGYDRSVAMVVSLKCAEAVAEARANVDRGTRVNLSDIAPRELSGPN